MEISITYFGFGGTYMLWMGHGVLWTFNNFMNFNIGKKIVKKCAFFMKSYFLYGINIFPKIAMLKMG